MSARRRNARRGAPALAHENYAALARGPWHSLLFIGPMLAAYEVNALFFGIDIFARGQIQRFLHELWPGAEHFSALLVLAVLAAWKILDGGSWRVRPMVLAGMAAESILLALPILGAALLGGRMLSATALSAELVNAPLFQTLMTRVGGGIYEEFIFRLAGFNLLGLLLGDMLKLSSRWTMAITLVVTSTLFAWCHFPGHTAIQWTSFAFYALSGAYLGAVFLLRGFGLAVGAHVAYNIFVTILEHLVTPT